MKIKDAFAILDIQADCVTPVDVQTAYRKAAAKYHPDRNPAGLEMMKLVNSAYEILKNFNGKIELKENESININYGQKINEALNAIMGLGLTIEICGSWIWVSGNTKPHKEKLKKAGFKWASQKVRWYFRPEGYKSRPHQAWPMKKIQEVYGRNFIKDEQQKNYKMCIEQQFLIEIKQIGGKQMNDDEMINFFGEIIHTYTRDEALKDGFLVDISEMAQEIGFKIPVAVTRAVWDQYIKWTDEDTNKQTIQDQSGRLRDVLWMLMVAIKVSRSQSDQINYCLNIVPRDGKSRRPARTQLKSLIGAGDNGKPVLTIMLLNED